MDKQGRRQRYNQGGTAATPSSVLSQISDVVEEPLITPQRASVSGFLLTLFLAFAIFAVSVGSAKYFFPRGGARQQQQQVALAIDGGNRSGDGYSTAQCTGDLSLPVLNGADLVAYFSLEEHGAAIFGVADYEAVYGGYRFLFASAENKALFEEDALRYIPAWGGFCGWGVSNEDWWTKDNLGPDADPNSWLIADNGVLYFFRSETPKAKFIGTGVSVNIEKGDAIWDSWWGGALPGGDGSPLNTACFCSVSTCGDG